MTTRSDPSPLAPTPLPLPRSGTLVRDHLATPVGRLELVAAPTGLRAVLWPLEDGSRIRRALTWVTGTPAEGRLTAAQETALGRAHLTAAVQQLEEYFAGTRTAFELTLDPVGTPFQLRAWRALRAIPFGQTRTYAEQARGLGQPQAARAVGAADGRNPLSIIVPCHRVLGARGSLTGYAGGVQSKAWLLAHEQATLAARAGERQLTAAHGRG